MNMPVVNLAFWHLFFVQEKHNQWVSAPKCFLPHVWPLNLLKVWSFPCFTKTCEVSLLSQWPWLFQGWCLRSVLWSGRRCERIHHLGGRLPKQNKKITVSCQHRRIRGSEGPISCKGSENKLKTYLSFIDNTRILDFASIRGRISRRHISQWKLYIAADGVERITELLVLKMKEQEAAGRHVMLQNKVLNKISFLQICSP